MAVLKQKTASKTTTFRVGIPAALAEEIDAVKKEAAEKGLVFDVAEIVTKALSSACKSARDELANS